MRLLENRALMIVIIATLAASVIAVLILVIAHVAGREKATPVFFPEENSPASIGRFSAPPVLSDFLPPETAGAGAGDDESWIPVRPLRKSWDRIEIERFWQDPAQAGLRVLSKENDELIKSYLESLP